jgi:hypothetical protein
VVIPLLTLKPNLARYSCFVVLTQAHVALAKSGFRVEVDEGTDQTPCFLLYLPNLEWRREWYIKSVVL